MFITKKHLSRRTLLKGAGVGLALPFLDAMVPAATALAQTAAAAKMRTAFFYLPHGAIMHNTAHGPAMDKWTPSGAGADFKLITLQHGSARRVPIPVAVLARTWPQLSIR